NEDVDIIINRIFNMVISMLEDSIEAINEKDWEALRKMKSRDYVMNSYVSYCQRLINKFGYSSFSKSGLIMVYLKIVEMISDKICAIFKHCAKNKINITLEIKQLLIIYRMIQRIHSKFDSKKISEFNKERLKLKSSKINVDEIKELLFDLIEVEIQFNI
ncbi:hypothetical protein KY321_02280, partial [Candidatus Woesearchaeota archaeon]|nr:hypothetical protein [Candidatus Woesearchaeota archaeon]